MCVCQCTKSTQLVRPHVICIYFCISYSTVLPPLARRFVAVPLLPNQRIFFSCLPYKQVCYCFNCIISKIEIVIITLSKNEKYLKLLIDKSVKNHILFQVQTITVYPKMSTKIEL